MSLCAGLLPGPALADTRSPAGAANGYAVPGVESRHLDARFWIGSHAAPAEPILDAGAIAERNRLLARKDPALYDIEALPAALERARVASLVSGLSSPPSRPLFDAAGQRVDADALRAVQANAAIDAIAGNVTVRHGMVVARAAMRTFPTMLRVFSTPGDTDIDRFQETALFPGTPLAIVHESRDGAWWFAISPRYAAWIEKRHVALGTPAQVFGYDDRTPFLVVTGAKVETVFNPDLPALSELQLDMGVRVPLLADWPAGQPVHGQHPYTSWVIELPVRNADGTLRFAPALLPRSADVATAYLPLTPANLLSQGFKFLGERYGWGHSYNARDCSGFVSEVYRSFGVVVPRNTSAQAVSPLPGRIAFDDGDDRKAREAVLRGLGPGDLVYIPGHVMMVVGQTDAGPYVIHDVTGVGVLDERGAVRRIPLNQVAVTPLLPLQAGEEATYVDRITSIQRLSAGAGQ